MDYCTLSVKSISCTRGRRELFTDLSFDISSGQSICIQGENGAGKTSLLRIIASLGEPDSGEIHWLKKPITSQLSRYKKNLSYIGFQNNLKLTLSPIENLQMAAGIEQGIHLSEQAVINSLTKFGITRSASMHSPCYSLSSGQQRRVSLARLALSECKIWILDEPFIGIDSAGINLLQQIFSEHNSRGGIILFASHLNNSASDIIKL